MGEKRNQLARLELPSSIQKTKSICSCSHTHIYIEIDIRAYLRGRERQANSERIRCLHVIQFDRIPPAGVCWCRSPGADEAGNSLLVHARLNRQIPRPIHISITRAPRRHLLRRPYRFTAPFGLAFYTSVRPLRRQPASCPLSGDVSSSQASPGRDTLIEKRARSLSLQLCCATLPNATYRDDQ